MKEKFGVPSLKLPKRPQGENLKECFPDSVLPKDASQVARWLCNYGNRIVPSLLITSLQMFVPLICRILRDRFKKSDVVLRPADLESVRRLPFPPSLDWDIHFPPPLLHPASHSPLPLTSHPHSEQSVPLKKLLIISFLRWDMKHDEQFSRPLHPHNWQKYLI